MSYNNYKPQKVYGCSSKMSAFVSSFKQSQKPLFNVCLESFYLDKSVANKSAETAHKSQLALDPMAFILTRDFVGVVYKTDKSNESRGDLVVCPAVFHAESCKFDLSEFTRLQSN